MYKHRLTTYDNPWNPYTHYKEWLAFDNRHGYRTQERLAAISVVSDKSSPEQNAFEYEDSMNRMCEMFPLFYKKVPRPA